MPTAVETINSYPYSRPFAMTADIIQLSASVSKAAGPSARDVIDEYFATVAPKSDWSEAARAMIDRHVLRTYGHLPLSFLDRAFLRALLEAVFLQGPGSARTLLKALKSFFQYAVRAELIAESPLAGFKLALPNTNRTTYTARELGRVVHLAGCIDVRWQKMAALSLATLVPIEDVRTLRAEEVDWDANTWTMTRQSATAALLVGSNVVPLSAYARWLLQDAKGGHGYVFRSPRTRHNGQSDADEIELPLSWRSSITDAIRQHAGIPGAWTFRDLRRSAAILSGVRKIESDYADAAPEVRAAKIATAMEIWGRRLSAAVDDCRPALAILDPVIRVEA